VGVSTNSRALYFDTYDFIGPDNIPKWVDRGADYDEWDLSPLIQDIETLQQEGFDYIVLDYPFAYQHSGANNYIDMVIFIDTPLDIALGRRLIRDFSNRGQQEILLDIDYYIKRGRSGYLEMLETIKPEADVVIVGTLPVAEIVGEIIANIGRIKVKK